MELVDVAGNVEVGVEAAGNWSVEIGEGAKSGGIDGAGINVGVEGAGNCVERAVAGNAAAERIRANFRNLDGVALVFEDSGNICGGDILVSESGRGNFSGNGRVVESAGEVSAESDGAGNAEIWNDGAWAETVRSGENIEKRRDGVRADGAVESGGLVVRAGGGVEKNL